MEKYAFAIMPFNEEHDEIYKHIKPVFEAGGFSCKRADEQYTPENISNKIIQLIEQANLILADITGKNPNVFYELAIAHSFNKPTIMISQETNDIPFDIRMYGVLSYENTVKGIRVFESQLHAIVNLFNYGQFRHGNPVWDGLATSPFSSILRTEDVLDLEKKALKKVCVIAPNIELGPGIFKDIMKENIINRNIEYQYLVSDDKNIVHDFHSFVKSLALGEKSSQFLGKFIDPKFVESDVTIIDPGSSNEAAFILAPSEKPDYHFKIVGSSLYRLKNRFNSLWFAADQIV